MTIAGRRKPKAYAAETAFQLQRIEVMTRDDWACRFEIAIVGLPRGETHHFGQRITWEGDVAWVRCGATYAVQTAHLWRKHKLGKSMTDDGIELDAHPLVAICGCPRHHTMFDMRGDRDKVRPPAEAVALAKMLIAHTNAAARARGEVAIDVDLTEFDRPLAEMESK